MHWYSSEREFCSPIFIFVYVSWMLPTAGCSTSIIHPIKRRFFTFPELTAFAFKHSYCRKDAPRILQLECHVSFPAGPRHGYPCAADAQNRIINHVMPANQRLPFLLDRRRLRHKVIFLHVMYYSSAYFNAQAALMLQNKHLQLTASNHWGQKTHVKQRQTHGNERRRQ